MNKLSILQSFCATASDMREYLRKPFIRNGFAYATNGHFIVRCPAEGLDLPELPDKLKNVEEMFAEKYGGEFAPLPSVRAPVACEWCRGKGSIYGGDCQDCDGEGDFEHGRHTYSCKECDGAGFMEKKKADGGEKTECRQCYGRGHRYGSQVIGSASFQLTYLHQLAKHKGIEFASGPNDKAAASFRFGEFTGLLMPTRSEA